MPGSVCSVVMCKSNAASSKKSGDNVRFFTFPKDAKLRREWIKRCFRNENFNADHKRICSKHFKPNDFEDEMEAKIQNRLPKILKRDCIPSLNLNPEVIINININNNPIKKIRLERAAKRKQKDFIKKILEAEKEQDDDESENDEVSSKKKQDKDMDESSVTDEDAGLTLEDIITCDAESRNRELERRISEFMSNKVQILVAEVI